MVKRIMRFAGLVHFSALASFAAPSPCLGETVAPPPLDQQRLLYIVEQQGVQLKDQQKAMAEQEKRFLAYQEKMERMLAEQQKALEDLKSRIAASPPRVLTNPKQKRKVQEPAPQVEQTAATKPSAGNNAKTSAPTGPPLLAEAASRPAMEKSSSPPPSQPVGQPPADPNQGRPPEVAPIFDQPGVLTSRGSWVVEPSLQFTNSSSDRIALIGYTVIPAITIGLIDVRRFARDTFVAAISARYGLTDRLELETKVPFTYRQELSSTTPFATATPNPTSSTDGYGLGDIELGLRYQINQPRSGPFYVASLRVKTDTGRSPFDLSLDPATSLPTELATGSGFWGVQPGISFIYPTDPAVLFGGVNYLWNVERQIGIKNGYDYGRIDPGDAYGFNFGLGVALNEKDSFSLGYEHSIIGRNRVNGSPPVGEVPINVGTVLLGYSHRYSDMLSLNLSLGVGATEAAPDVQIVVRMPYSL
ncbi:MAG: transporter [Thermodesulfobacteriota bacterium]